MQMTNNTTQQHLRQPTFLFSRKNELPQVGFEPTTSSFPGKRSTNMYRWCMYTMFILAHTQCRQVYMYILYIAYFTLYTYNLWDKLHVKHIGEVYLCNNLYIFNDYLHCHTHKPACDVINIHRIVFLMHSVTIRNVYSEEKIIS